MLKRQAGVTDAQQATSLTYSVVKYTKIVFNCYQALSLHEYILTNWAKQGDIACRSCCIQSQAP